MSDMTWEHASEARAALNAIVTDPEHGVSALSNAQTMSNLLKDYLPDAPREKSILVAAAEAGLADTLRDHVSQGMDPNTAIRLTASSFSSSTPFTPEACNWVTDEIAVALGISQPRVGGAGQAGSAGQAGGGLGGTPAGFAPIGNEGAATQMAPGAPGAPGGFQQAPGSFQQGQPGNQAPGQGYQQGGARQGYGAPGQVGQGGVGPGGIGQAGTRQGAPGQPNPQDMPTAQGYRPGFGQAQPGGFGQPQGQGYPGQPGGPQQAPPQAQQAPPQPYQPQPTQRFPGQPQPYPGQQQPQPYQPQQGRGYPGQPGFAQPGQPGGWGPGGYGPGGGFGPAPKPSGSKRGLLVGGGILLLVIVVIVVAVLLSSKPSHTTSGGGGHGTPTASASSTPTQSSSTPAPTGSVEPLTTILNPAGLTPVGTDCIQGLLFGLKASTITSRIFCAKTTKKNIEVWGYQFDSHPDYLAGFAHINTFTGFSKTADGCPPPSGDDGVTSWHANANPKYVTRPGQVIECFLDNNKPLLIWTMPTMNTFFIARDIGKGDTNDRLIAWWKTVNYG